MRSSLARRFAAFAAGSALVVACRDQGSDSMATSTADDGGADGRGDGGSGPSSATSGSGSSSGGSGGSGGSGSGSGSGGGFASCGIGMSPGGGAGGGSSDGRVRVVAANLSSGNGQDYDGGHGIRILQGLAADIVLMQEMNYGSNATAAIDILVDDVCDGGCNYIRGPQAQIPNGVLSRLPILDCGSWEDPEVDNRNFVWARIDVPGEADLWAISAHFLTESASSRDDEADALLDHILDDIPASDLIVLGADLNTNARSESAISKLSSLFETDGPHPVDQEGNDATNAPRDKPYDWVLADDELLPFQVPVEIGDSVFPSGAVIDTRLHDPLSEIAPALAGDSATNGMQHMAVVKDFRISAP